MKSVMISSRVRMVCGSGGADESPKAMRRASTIQTCQISRGSGLATALSCGVLQSLVWNCCPFARWRMRGSVILGDVWLRRCLEDKRRAFGQGEMAPQLVLLKS